MNIFALDTSSRAASCAVMRDGTLVGEYFYNIGLNHSQTIMRMAQSLLETTALKVEDIDVFAVTLGPGSFTGLRIGIASVKGMALAADKPCAGISTLHALASNLPRFEGYIAPMMDARRAQVYTALFHSCHGRLTRIAKDAAISFEEAQRGLSGLDGPVMLVGDGAVIFHQTLEDPGNIIIAPERCLHQRASAVAVLALSAAENGALVAADLLAPSYLRISQAERERKEMEFGRNESQDKEP